MSSGTISSEAIRNSFHTLRQYIRDLQDSAPLDSATIAQRFSIFSTKLRLLVNFAEKDDVCRWLARVLHARAGSVVPWFRAICAGEIREIEDVASVQLAHRYAVLEAIKRSAIDLRTFVSTVCARPGGFVEAFIAFRHLYIDEFRTRMEALLDQMESHLDGQNAPFDTLVQTALSDLDGPPVAEAPAKPGRKEPVRKAAKKTAKKAAKKAAKKTAQKTAQKTAKKTAKKATKKTAKKATKKAAKRAARKRR